MFQASSISIEVPGRENLKIVTESGSDGVAQVKALQGVGPLDFLRKLEKWRPILLGSGYKSCPLPDGNSPGELMLREAVLKLRGEWKFPYAEDEICHCRAVPTSVVDGAIVVGAHSMKKIKARTGASTACGTCTSDVTAVLKYRLSDNS